MRLLAIAILTLATAPSYAAEPTDKLTCKVVQNLQDVGQVSLPIPEVGKKAAIAEVGDFEIAIHGMGDNLYELEIYDIILPARNYAKGLLQESGDSLEITIWQRRIILSTHCTRH